MWKIADNKKFFEELEKLENEEIADNLVDLIRYGCSEWPCVNNFEEAFNETFKQLKRLSSGDRTSYEQDIVKNSGGEPVGKFKFESFKGEMNIIEISPVGKKSTDRFYIQITFNTDDKSACILFYKCGHTRKI